MTQKILYAVQSKQIEDVISRSLTAQTNGGIVSVGSAGYREQVLPSLKQTGADILLYREGLKGGTGYLRTDEISPGELPGGADHLHGK